MRQVCARHGHNCTCAHVQQPTCKCTLNAHSLVLQALGGKREVSARDVRGLVDRLQQKTTAAAKLKSKKRNKQRLAKQNAAMDARDGGELLVPPRRAPAHTPSLIHPRRCATLPAPASLLPCASRHFTCMVAHPASGDDDGDTGTAAAARVAAAPAAAPPAWLKQHRIRLPTDWRARHDAAMKLPAWRAKFHTVTWRTLREMQSEDEERVQRGHKKRMRWMCAAEHIKRTSYTCMKAGHALRVLSMDTANQMRLRRHGGWA